MFIIIYSFLLSCKQSRKAPSSPVQTAIQGHSYESTSKLSLEYKIRQPSIKSEETPILILLHGLGSNESDLFSFAQHIDNRMLVVSVRAPIRLKEDRYSWYSLSRNGTDWLFNDKEVLKASETILQFVDELAKAYNLEGSPIYLGGFSQGAIVSLGTALLHPDRIRGAISMSGQLYPVFIDAYRRNYTTLELLVTHGRKDGVLPFSQIEKDVEILKQKGLNPEVYYYDSAHNISNENFKDLMNWLTRSLDKNS